MNCWQSDHRDHAIQLTVDDQSRGPRFCELAAGSGRRLQSFQGLSGWPQPAILPEDEHLFPLGATSVSE